MLNTIKTTLGFLVAALEKHTPLNFHGDTIEDSYNYLKISDSLATSGQPTEKQFHDIQASGYQMVINLAPNSVVENSLKSERALLSELGIEYVHISVDFGNPTEDDFERFVSSLQGAVDSKVWVHCAANLRVSAFIYRYRCSVLGENKHEANSDLQKIWEPLGVWKTFVSKANST